MVMLQDHKHMPPWQGCPVDFLTDSASGPQCVCTFQFVLMNRHTSSPSSHPPTPPTHTPGLLTDDLISTCYTLGTSDSLGDMLPPPSQSLWPPCHGIHPPIPHPILTTTISPLLLTFPDEHLFDHRGIRQHKTGQPSSTSR